jgi:hypothetical protein
LAFALASVVETICSPRWVIITSEIKSVIKIAQPMRRGVRYNMD